MLNRRELIFSVVGLAGLRVSLRAQARAPSDAIVSRCFVEFVLEQAGFKTTGIPALRSDLATDVKLGIAVHAPEVELIDSRVGRLKTGLAIGSAMLRKGDTAAAWLKNRATDAANTQLAQLEATNEVLVNKAFTSASASEAIVAQGRVRASIATDLAGLEREFRSAVTAALSKEPTINVLATSVSSQELATSRAQVRRLLAEAGPKSKP